MLVGDIVEVVLKGTVSSQQMVNVWHMLVNGDDYYTPGDPFTSGSMEELRAMAFELMIEDIQPWATSQVNWQGIEVRNLFNVLELGAIAYSPVLAGTNAGEMNNSFSNPVLKSVRKIYGMHGGRKALAPVSEAVSGNNLVSGGLIASLALMATKWNTLAWPINTPTGSYTLVPVVVKRVRAGAGTPTDPYTYRLPVSQIEATYYLADNWAPSQFLGSQVSRKFGQGS